MKYAIILLAGTSLMASAAMATNADAIWYGGHIITVDAKASTAEAVAVKNGLIVAVGKQADVEKAERGPATAMNDLKGKVMAPGFIDGHSHFSFALDMADQANASAPPVGPGSSPAAIVAALKQFATARNVPAGQLIVGYGYDETQMQGGQPLSRDILDAAFPNNPVYVIHVSGHGAVLNSLAFAKYGISAATPTPAGGIIQRKPGSMEPSGLVMETGYLPVFLAKTPPTPDELVKQLKFAQDMYASAGITTAQDGATHTNDLANFQKFAAAKLLYLDLVSYAFFLEPEPIMKANPPASWGKYSNNFKLGGCKIVSDGSPQAKTAAFTTPYLTGGPTGQVNWKGELSATQDQFNTAMKLCYDNGLQVLVHVNGDAAVDAALSAHEYAAAGSLGKDRRTVLVHSQFARLDQLDKYVPYKIIPSMFTEHTFFFGDVHVANRGKTQAYFESPIKTAIGMKLQPTNHTDFNVAPINQLWTIWTAVNRTSRTGVVIGPEERITPYQALQAITINGAHQYGEEASKGSIETGKRADLVILDSNPLTVAHDKIKDIKVVQTIKDGKAIYTAP